MCCQSLVVEAESSARGWCRCRHLFSCRLLGRSLLLEALAHGVDERLEFRTDVHGNFSLVRQKFSVVWNIWHAIMKGERWAQGARELCARFSATRASAAAWRRTQCASPPSHWCGSGCHYARCELLALEPSSSPPAPPLSPVCRPALFSAEAKREWFLLPPHASRLLERRPKHLHHVSVRPALFSVSASAPLRGSPQSYSFARHVSAQSADAAALREDGHAKRRRAEHGHHPLGQLGQRVVI